MNLLRAKTGNTSSKMLRKFTAGRLSHSHDKANFKMVDICHSEDSEMIYRAGGTFVGLSDNHSDD